MVSWPLNPIEIPDTLLEKAQMLQNMLVENATNGNMNERIYLLLRQEFMSNPPIRDLLPDFVRSNRTSGALRGYFQKISPQWQPRREHIWNSFMQLFYYLEGKIQAPADSTISQTLDSLENKYVSQAWHKALERRIQDPEGAITAARTLLESICKSIIDESGQFYGEKDDLPKLYHQAAQILNLAPSQHTEEIFKIILGGCQQVVQGLGTLRNKIGDAHGHGEKRPTRPSPRHAALAVNLAGSMATFMAETWKSQMDSEKTFGGMKP